MPRMLRHIETGELWGYNAAMAEHKMLREYDPDHPELWEYGEFESKPEPSMHTAVATTEKDAIEMAMAKAADAGKVEIKKSPPSTVDDLAGLSTAELEVKRQEAEQELAKVLADSSKTENTKNVPPPPLSPGQVIPEAGPPPAPAKSKK